MTTLFVLSHFQAQALLDARRQQAKDVSVSLDLNLSTTTVTLSEQGIYLPEGTTLQWSQIETMIDDVNSCFVVEDNMPHKIQIFSEETNRYYSLMPTVGAPTMLISGIPMHRIKGTDPQRDTREKTKAAKPIIGEVLDTATGLGYTAIAASKTAEHVTTIELDPAALEICRMNPWSQSLFDNPKITQCIGDSFDVVEEMEDARFTRVLHDPPMLNMAGHLYSADFYADLYRVLVARGRLFHYIGDPESKSGRTVTRGVIQRLEQVGFSHIKRAPHAFGVVAYK